MKELLLREMLQLTKKQSDALKREDFDAIERIGNEIEEVQCKIKEWDRMNKEKNSESINELLVEIQEWNSINSELGSRHLAHLKKSLKTVRQQQRNSNAYNNPYAESGLIFDRR